MQHDAAKLQIAQLRKDITEHDRRYYIEFKPVISDTEYDRLMRELTALETANPKLVTPDSPTQRVAGAPIKGFGQVRHSSPMLSLDNTYNKEELVEFDNRIRKAVPGEAYDYIVELKIDGIAVSLTYENGLLTSAATRGDGWVGDDITLNARTIKSIPLGVTPVGRLGGMRFHVRGEIYMPDSSFNRVNEERIEAGEEPFANPRNAAGGSLKQLDPRVAARRGLSIFTYALVPEGDPFALGSQFDTFQALRMMGFPVNPHLRSCADIMAVVDCCNEWEDRRETLDYQIDGMVVKVNNLNMQDRLGATGKSPRWAISYKFAAKQATTTVEDIIPSVGRTGVITPVANLRPVQLGGVTISHAALFNADEIERLGINVGDTVVVERGGEVIPRVVKVVEKHSDGNYRLPAACPACGGETVREPGEAATRCINIGCPVQLQKNIENFASKGGMDIEGLGPKVVGLLIDSNLISDASDLYSLTVEQLVPLERMGQKSAENLVSAIQNSRTRPLDRVYYSLGIRHIGDRSAEILAERYPKLESLGRATVDELKQIFEIGPVLAENIHEFFHEQKNLSVIEKLRLSGVRMEAEAGGGPEVAQTLMGKSFVFTGTISMPRAEAEALVKARGGRISSSVSKKTDYVVAGYEPGSKYVKAQELGVTVLTEEEFKGLMGT